MKERWKKKIERHSAFLSKCIESRGDSVLVVAGGETESMMLRNLGFVDVTISNLASHYSEVNFHPYKYQSADANDLPFKNCSFDWVVIRDAIHHCSQPHRALTEIWRCSRKGVILFEANDSPMMRALQRLGFVEVFEHSAIVSGVGGVDCSNVPNYVYKWTRREILKTLESFAPELVHDTVIEISFLLPARLEKFWFSGVLDFVAKLFFSCFRGWGNQFACCIIKDLKNTKPWISDSQSRW